MKFLIDESIHKRVADLLTEQGHDAVHLLTIDLGGSSDVKVLAAARQDDRVVITADTDFGDLLALSGEPQPSVVLLRRPGRRPEERTQAILTACEARDGRGRATPNPNP